MKLAYYFKQSSPRPNLTHPNSTNPKPNPGHGLHIICLYFYTYRCNSDGFAIGWLLLPVLESYTF